MPSFFVFGDSEDPEYSKWLVEKQEERIRDEPPFSADFHSGLDLNPRPFGIRLADPNSIRACDGCV
jgi:hypothetical protein